MYKGQTTIFLLKAAWIENILKPCVIIPWSSKGNEQRHTPFRMGMPPLHGFIGLTFQALILYRVRFQVIEAPYMVALHLAIISKI